MATDLIIPPLGESITEAIISKWLKQPGETTAMDEPVVDLETDKVSVTLPAPAAGVLGEQRAAAGETVKVGDVIGTIIAGGAAKATVGDGGQKTGQKEKKAVPAASAASAVSAVSAGSDQAVSPTKNAKAAAPVVAAEPVAKVATSSVASNAIAQDRKLPPSVRRAIREHDGDVVGAAGAVVPVAVPVVARAPVVTPASNAADEEVVSMTPLRKRIAERLVAAQHTAAILTTFNEVDMSAVMALREKYKDAFFAKYGVKLGFMSFFAKACVEGLKEYPGLNAEVRGNDIVYKKHYDLGIAVGGGRGLVVPVVRAVDKLSFAEIEKAIADLGARAKENKLTLDELAGGTFSITNGGIYGSLLSTPLLNLPQTGILGMHNIVKRPVAVGDEIALRPMMYVAVSYDHRVADGREAVQFLVSVKQRLEAPERMLFSV